MPKIDGFSVATEIRKVDKVIPILFLTSKSQTQDVVTGFKIGCNDYIRKPFSMEELIQEMHILSSNNNILSVSKKVEEVRTLFYLKLKQHQKEKEERRTRKEEEGRSRKKKK